MKIDEAVKLMETGRICRCIDTHTSNIYRIDKETLQFRKEDKLIDLPWRDSFKPIDIIKSEWELVEEDVPLDSKVVYLHHEDSHGNRCSVNVYPFWGKKDIETFILNIKSIKGFNDLFSSTKQDIFEDIDKLAGPRFKVTML